MNRNEIISRLREILEDTVGNRRKLDEDQRLKEDLGLSSVDILYLHIATEETFHIRFKNVGVRDLSTVGDVVRYIEGALA